MHGCDRRRIGSPRPPAGIAMTAESHHCEERNDEAIQFKSKYPGLQEHSLASTSPNCQAWLKVKTKLHH